MTERIQVNGVNIWIMIEPHITPMAADARKEFFSASYLPIHPNMDFTSGSIFDRENNPIAFRSPKEAIAFAYEKLSASY